MNDEATINLISNNQKPQNAKVVRFIVNVNRILNVLREFDGNCSKKQLAEKLPDFDFDSKANLEELSQYNRIKYDPVREIFELKSEYNIKNIEDLKQLIKTRKNGILEDEMLNDSYPGIKNDIEKLKKEIPIDNSVEEYMKKISEGIKKVRKSLIVKKANLIDKNRTTCKSFNIGKKSPIFQEISLTPISQLDYIF